MLGFFCWLVPVKSGSFIIGLSQRPTSNIGLFFFHLQQISSISSTLCRIPRGGQPGRQFESAEGKA